MVDEVSVYFEESEIGKYLYEIFPGKDVSIRNILNNLWYGNWSNNTIELISYLKSNICNYLFEWKVYILSFIGIFVLSALVSTFMESYNNNSAASIARLLFVAYELIFLMQLWNEELEIGKGTIDKMIEFIKLVIPSFMICVGASGSSITAMTFSQLFQSFICLVEVYMLKITVPLVYAYMFIGIFESIFDEKRFSQIREMLKSFILLILKGLIILISGYASMQLLITPVIDQNSLNLARKTAAAIPGIGDIAESAASITLSSALTIKNTYGVLILVGIILILLVPIVKMFMIIAVVRVGGALGGITGEKMMEQCTMMVADAGYLYLRIVLTVATLFFIAIATLTNATGGI